MLAISSCLTSIPRSDLTRLVRRCSSLCGELSGAESTNPLCTLQPNSSCSRWAVRLDASITPWGSTRRSKRCEASLRRPRAREERRITLASNDADSRSTRLVSGRISLRSPPITPATARPPSSSVIISTSSVSSRSISSSVRNLSPLRARRTVIVFPMRSASNGCSGWPISSMT